MSTVVVDAFKGYSDAPSFGFLAKPLADADYVVSQLERETYEQIDFTGALTAGRTVTLAPIAGAKKWVRNSMTGGNALQVRAAGQVGVPLLPGVGRWIWSDGADWYLMDAPTGYVPTPIPSDANYTVPQSLYAAGDKLEFTGGALTATRNMVLPLSMAWPVLIVNSSSGAQSIQVIGASGTGVTLANGKSQWMRSNGTNWVAIGAAY